MTDEEMWKRRFLQMMLLRLGGTALTIFGMVVAFSNVFAAGGDRPVGIALIAAGLAELLIVPKLLRKHWNEQ